MSHDYTETRALAARLRIDGSARTGNEAADALEAQAAELERVTSALRKANSQAEHFEREWYLRGDELERVRAERDALRADAERWRYLRAHSSYVDHEVRSLGELIVPPIRRWYHDTNYTQYDTLDAAIDAAIDAATPPTAKEPR